ncbi:hypothetical protein HWV62_42623 [Athelia sp. TMB]|nr:hypothetical protein HWV62_42623 [Athelia sp. TMB]
MDCNSITADNMRTSTALSLALSLALLPLATSATGPLAHVAHQEPPHPQQNRVQININAAQGPTSTPAAPPVPTPLMMGYYPDWTAFAPEQIDFARFDWVDFAFAVPAAPTAAALLTWDDPRAPDLLARLVAAAHAAGRRAKLSIGGWTGSAHFSALLATPASRSAFATSVAGVYAQYGVDGVEFDWEYPGEAGAPGNGVARADSAHFLEFLGELRGALPRGAVVTAAVQSAPFAGPDGAPLADVRAFAGVLDWVLVMNYDVWGSSANPGPNAPLYDRCGNSTQPGASALAAFAQWTAAGFPAAQLVLGVPAYGYVSRSAATRLVQRRGAVNRRASKKNKSKGKADADADAAGDVEVKPEDEGDDGGQVMFAELVAQGALLRHPPPPSPPANPADPQLAAYTAAGGYTRRWDACSSTPFLTSLPSSSPNPNPQVIAYDDPQSVWMKAAFARRAGMLGVNVFDVHGDVPQWDLVDAARAGLGLPAVGAGN